MRMKGAGNIMGGRVREGILVKKEQKNACRNRCRDGFSSFPEPRREPLFSAFRSREEEFCGPQLQILGGKKLVAEGCCTVLYCDEDLVRLRLSGTVATVMGAGLSVEDFTELSPQPRKERET